MKKKSVKHLLHFMLLCMPLILLLIACIFPTKHINNTYALEETTTTETETSVDFNQLLLNRTQNLPGVISSFNNGIYSINGTSTTSGGRLSQQVELIDVLENNKYMLTYKKISGNADYFLYFSDYYSYNALFGLRSNQTYITFTATSNSKYILGYNLNNNINYNESFYINLYNLTLMGLEDISYNDFIKLFPLNYYPYNEGQEITLSSLTITNNIGNQAEQPLQSNETKQPNEAILMPYKTFYSLEVNNWYRSLLELIGVDISSTDLVQGYLLYFPLWAMWFWLFELIELAVTLVPKLVYEIYTKLSRSKDE